MSVIRTVTVGVADPHPVPASAFARAADTARALERGFAATGHEVQTLRLATRSVFDADLPDLLGYAVATDRVLVDVGIDACALGPAPAARADFALDVLSVLPELIGSCPSLSVTVALGTIADGVRAAAAPVIADVVRAIAASTPGGIGNFRFAATANVGPGHPFFPAAYHTGPPAFTLGLQSAGIVEQALRGCPPDPAAVTARTRAALTAEAAPVAALAADLAQRHVVRFAGIDLSPAPNGEVSIGAAVEHVVGRFGAPGTLAVAAALTAALRSVTLPQCGYTGLMLPILEDVVLARAWESGRLGFHQMLAYSAVCGTGLDTVPLPGDVSTSAIAGLLLDTAALAARLDKPLSARLLPVPGCGPGDRTDFGSPHLVDIILPEDKPDSMQP